MRLFTCGDIHGCLDELSAALDRVNFDKSCDMLVALGDLVDRGPKSKEVVMLLKERWFTSIKGNHEVLMERSLSKEIEDVQAHVQNGGSWFHALPRWEQIELVDLVKDLYVAMTVFTPSRRKIGLVHADLPHWDWDHFADRIADDVFFEAEALWGRKRIKAALSTGYASRVENVDHVYMGHSIVREPMTFENITWIDTGCFKTGKLTLVELH